MIPPETISNIIETSRIEEVIGDYVNLKRRGVNLIGLCPFHDEKTPSFIVSPSKGIFKCFGCGKAGNSVKFLMEHEHYSYPEALRFLAAKYNIAIEEFQRQPREDDKYESLYIVNSYARDYFSRMLWETEEGKNIGQSYFRERSFREDTVRKFELGYAPEDGSSFSRKARTNGYPAEILKRCGLATEKEGREYDFFRARVIFPIHNMSGKVVAFAGRTLSSDPKAPKYINSPETDIYHKSQVLYGAFHARNEIRKLDSCWLVEGYTDVISLHQAGICHVLASSGTSLTQGQVRLIKRYTRNLTLLYDGDEAGIKAALRGMEILLAEDMNIRIVLLPGREDPDSFLRSHGAEEFREFVKRNQKDFILFKTGILSVNAGKDPASKAALVKEIVATIATIPDAIKRTVYTKECSQLMGVGEHLVFQELNRIARTRMMNETGAYPGEAYTLESRHYRSEETLNAALETAVTGISSEAQERELIRIIIEYGDKSMKEGTSVASFLADELGELTLTNPVYSKIMNEAKSLVHEGRKVEGYFQNHPDVQVSTLAIELALLPYEISKNWDKMHDIIVTDPSENYRNDVRYSVNSFKLKKVLGLIDENLSRMKDETDTARMENLQRVDIKLNEWLRKICSELGWVLRPSQSRV